MKFLGNLLWLILGGFLVFLYYFVVGLLFCLTIIGIPFGLQLMKIGVFALWPFGSDIQPDTNDGGCLSIIMNVIWILVGGIEITMLHNHNRHTIRHPALQDGSSGPYAFR